MEISHRATSNSVASHSRCVCLFCMKRKQKQRKANGNEHSKNNATSDLEVTLFSLDGSTIRSRFFRKVLVVWGNVVFTVCTQEFVHSYLLIWLCLRTVIHLPRASSEVLMFPASFIRSPVVLVFACLSDPAKSQNDNLQSSHR